MDASTSHPVSAPASASDVPMIVPEGSSANTEPAPQANPDDSQHPFWCSKPGCQAIQSCGPRRHHALVHQPGTTISFSDGDKVDSITKIYVGRDPETHQFHCPRCNEKSPDPFQLQKHAKSCASVPEPTTATSANDPADSDPIPSPRPQPRPPRRRPAAPAAPPSSRAPPPVQVSEAHGRRAQIPPGEHIELDGEDFRRLSVFVDHEHPRIGCHACFVTVKPSSLYSHLREHGLRGFPKTIGASIARRYDIPDTHTIPRPLQVPCAAIFGLDILENFWFCGLCGYGYSTEASLITHHNKKHGVAVARPEPARGPAQSFYRHDTRSYFRVVKPKPPVTPVSSAFDMFLRDRPVISLADKPIEPPENHRQLSRFLAEEDWFEHVQGVRASEILSISRVPKDNVVLLRLLPHVKKWLYSSQPIVRRTDENILVRISQCDSDDYLKPRRLSRLEPKSCDKYALTIAAALGFVLRSKRGELGDYEMELTDDQNECAEDAYAALQEEGGSVRDGEDEEKWDQLIQNLAFSLVAQKKKAGQHSRWFSPLIRFAVLHNVTSEGDFRKSNDITQSFAHIVWFARACLVRHITALEQDESREDEDRDIHKLCDEMSPYFRRLRTTTPLSYIVNTWAYIGTMATLEQGIPRFGTTNGSDVVVEGVAVSRDSLAECLPTLIDEYNSIIADEVCLGLPPDLFALPDVDIIFDNLQDFSVGYSFLDDKRNPFHEMKDRLVEELLTNPITAGRLHYVRNGKVEWISGVLHMILRAESRATALLVVMFVITSGAPGRGEEIAMLLVRNMPGGSIRNLLVLMSFICLVGGYSKTSKIQRKDKVTPRPLLQQVKRLLVLHLAVYRPAMRTFVQILGLPSETIERYEYALWPGLYKQTRGEDVSSALKHVTEQHLGVGMGILTYRHFIKALDRTIRDPGNVKHWNDEQAGHNTNIAERFYGLTMALLRGAGDERIIGCLRASAPYHMIFGCSAVKEFLEKNGHSGVAKAVKSSGSAAVDVDELARTLKALTVEDYKRTIKLAIDDNSAQAAAMWFPPPPIAPSVRLVLEPTHLLHASALVKLRRFTGNPNAMFKSSTQAIALEAILSRQCNYLIVASTGLGKTFLSLLIAKEFEHDMTTIIVLPLHSLHYDFERRCRASNVSVAKWTWKNPSPTAAIVYVSVEEATKDGFTRYIKTLSAENRLARFWIDEAHLAMTQLSFRPVFSELSALIERPVPIILTTATCPPYLEDRLWSVFGSTMHRTIRGPSDRPEAQDEFIELPASEHLAKLKELLDERVKGYRPQDRAIIFCSRIDICDAVAAELGLAAYHSQIDEDVRDTAFKEFLANSPRRRYAAIVATTMLTHGADVPAVRDVIHLNLPPEMMQGGQARGRGGRDGEPYRNTVIFDRTVHHYEQKGEYGEKAIKDMAIDTTYCRRIWWTKCLDGRLAGQTCITTPNAQICDNCKRAIDEQAPRHRVSFPAHIGRPPVLSNLASLAIPPRRVHPDERQEAPRPAAAAAPGNLGLATAASGPTRPRPPLREESTLDPATQSFLQAMRERRGAPPREAPAPRAAQGARLENEGGASGSGASGSASGGGASGSSDLRSVDILMTDADSEPQDPPSVTLRATSAPPASPPRSPGGRSPPPSAGLSVRVDSANANRDARRYHPYSR